jgi:thiol-disulfide isomerase/thioredoxin
VQAISRRLSVVLGACLWIAASHAASAADEIAIISPDGIDALVASNEGKVVVVNFWATWCPPCLREFPDIIEVYEEYREQGLEVVAVSMNEADESEDIQEFIENFAPPFDVYRASTADFEFYEGVLESWFGEMPMTLVFDTAGETAHIHKRPLTYDELAADVAALLP